MKRAGKGSLPFISMIREIKILSGAFQEATIQSGGRGPSLSPTPLGTARASFPAGGSGHSKPWLMSHSRSSHPREVWVPERIDQSALSAFRALDASFLAAR
jgi:hypothetical protein